MKKELFKLLTVMMMLVTTSVSFASLNQEDLKTHLRWVLQTPKDQLHVNKKLNIIRIQTLNMEIYKKISTDLAAVQINKNYFANIEYSTENYPEEPATIKIQLKDDTVELFSFYKESEKMFVMDFWINQDLVQERAEALAKLKENPIKTKKLELKKEEPKVVATASVEAPKTEEKETPKNTEIVIDPDQIDISQVRSRHVSNGYKDFRYGGAFIWNYPAFIPVVNEDINLKRKIPADFYQIKDREFSKDEKETHMQLSINLYRKEKWGLMAKSVDLYEKKYGEDKNKDMNEFLKLNSILKKNLTDQNKSLEKSAINSLQVLISRTEDYEMQRALYRYTLQYYKNTGQYLDVLKMAKKYFIDTKKNFDKEQTEYAALLILDSLAHLKQTDKIKTFIKDLNQQNLISTQTIMAYTLYSDLELGDTEDVIKNYESVKNGLAKPVHPAILYNAAEAYFREARFPEAIKLFDEFAADYSYVSQASHARLRIALAYEITEKDAKKVEILYKNAIDRAPVPEIRYEAKLRYIGMKVARKESPDKADLEALIFFDQSPDEKEKMSMDLKKLLWLVRMRTYINQNQYENALTYVTSLPLESLKEIERRVFEGDGAEIVYGLIKEHYANGNYARAVKLWEVYKDKYESKVAKNPYMNFVVCDSFLKLGMYKSFDRSLSILKSIDKRDARSFPVWIDRKDMTVASMIDELEMIKNISSNDWESAQKLAWSENAANLNKLYYYRLIIQNAKKENQKTADSAEQILTNPDYRNKLNKKELSDVVLAYIESLNQLTDKERFDKAARALIKDLRKIKSDKLFGSVYERVGYLYIEFLAGSRKSDVAELLILTERFLEEFKDSDYKWRVSYIRGVALVNGVDAKKGKDFLKALLENKDAPESIRDLARSELSALEITNNL